MLIQESKIIRTVFSLLAIIFSFLILQKQIHIIMLHQLYRHRLRSVIKVTTDQNRHFFVILTEKRCKGLDLLGTDLIEGFLHGFSF